MNKGCQVEFELEEVQKNMEVEKLEKKQSETLQHAAWKHEQQSQCGVKICGMDETPKELRLSFKDIVLSKLADLNMNTPAIEKIRRNSIDKQDSIDVAFDDYFKQNTD